MRLRCTATSAAGKQAFDCPRAFAFACVVRVRRSLGQLFVDVSDNSSKASALHHLGARWRVEVEYCNRPDFARDEGLLVFQRTASVMPAFTTVSFQSLYGAPTSLTGNDHVLVDFKDGTSLTYLIPPACVFRLSSSPLLAVTMATHASGSLRLVTAPADGVSLSGPLSSPTHASHEVPIAALRTR